MGKKPKRRLKHRDKTHVIGDVALNHVRSEISKATFASMTPEGNGDYGYDLVVQTFESDGSPENGSIYMQVRGSKALSFGRDSCCVARIEARHLRFWINELYPVVLVRYCRKTDRGYWLHVQAEWEKLNCPMPTSATATVSLKVPKKNRLNSRGLRKIADVKAQILGTLWELKEGFDDEEN